MVKNYIDQHNIYSKIEKQYSQNELSDFLQKNSQDGYLYFYDKMLKYRFSKYIASDERYSVYFDRDCVITGQYGDRHRVRWVLKFVEFTFFKNLFSLQANLPYYAYFLIYGLMTWLGFFLCMQTTGYTGKNVCIYLFSITFIFQHSLSEIGFSTIETAMITLALFASYRKILLLFIGAVICATLNRESGIVIALLWFVFNKDFKVPLIASLFSGMILLIVNFDIIECFLKPNFFIPFEKQSGQFNISDVGEKISFLSLFRTIVDNFLIPLGVSFYFYIQTNNKSNPLFYIICLYYLIFVLATPLHHISVKMITVPLIVLLTNPDLLNLRGKEKYSRVI